VYATRPTTTAVAAAASRGQRRRHCATERLHGLAPDLRPSSRTSSSSAGEFGASAHSTPSRTRQAFPGHVESASLGQSTQAAARGLSLVSRPESDLENGKDGKGIAHLAR
jgi:hypothetical protein